MTAIGNTTTLAPPDSGALPSSRQLVRRVAIWVTALAAGVVVITSLPGLEELPNRFTGADVAWLGVVLLLEVLSTISFSLAFHGAFERRVTPRGSASLSLAIQGMNILLPAGGSGGLAVGTMIMTRAGVPTRFAASRSVALFLLTSLATFVAVFFAGIGVATGVLSGDAGLVATLGPAAGAVLVVLGIVALPRALRGEAPENAGRMRRGLYAARTFLRDGIASSIEMLRARDRLVIWGSIGYLAFDVAALSVSFTALGEAGLPVGVLILAYTLGHAGAIVPLPGSAEGGLIGMFVLYGAPLTTAAAAIVIYRVVQSGVPVVLGLIGLADVRRQMRSGRPLHRGSLRGCVDCG
jgi:uncharacterized membrane protein YbhN (UPF0104 family)